MDWRLYQAIYGVSLHHHWVGTLFTRSSRRASRSWWSSPSALWLLARPGGSRKWKLAATAALGSAALALAVNRAIASLIWHRDRPYQTHAIAHPWSSSHDASFPSDHSSASFAIAFAVLMFDPLAGALFLLAAVVIGVGRLFIGAHYPGDVAAGVLVGFAAAIVVTKLLRPVISAARPPRREAHRPDPGSAWRLGNK